MLERNLVRKVFIPLIAKEILRVKVTQFIKDELLGKNVVLVSIRPQELITVRND